MAQEEPRSEVEKNSEEAAAKLETRDPAELKPHPTNIEVYGDGPVDGDFVDRVREAGEIVDPLTIRKDNVILGGHRRWRAAKELGFDEVPVIVEEPGPEVDERWRILELNDYRDKSFSDKMGEAELFEKLRDENNWSLQNFAGGEYDAWRDAIADRVGFGSGENYRKAKKIWVARESDHEHVRETAKEQLQKLDSSDPDESQSIHGAFQKVNHAKKRAHDREKIEWNEWTKVESQLLVVESCNLVFKDARDSLNTEDSWWKMLYDLFQEWTQRAIDDRHSFRRIPPHISTMRLDYYSFSPSFDGTDLSYIFLYLLEREGLASLPEQQDASQFELASLVERKPSADELEEVYWEKEIPIWQIAMVLGVHERLIEYWMWEDDIPVMRGDLDERTLERIDDRRDEIAS